MMGAETRRLAVNATVALVRAAPDSVVMQRITTWMRSEQPNDRLCAAFVLGFARSDAARDTLLQLAPTRIPRCGWN